ncbi:uncharacterized protein LOC144132361 [Amblyomma americanum]
MAARRLHLVLLHVLQMMAIFDAAAMSTCLPMNGAASTEQVCSADLAFLGDASPLDFTALPALERFIDWQPWNLPHKHDLHKQLLYPATPGSGADMAARRLHLVLHVLQMMAIFDAAAMSTCLPMNGAASTEQVCSADLAFLGDASPLDFTALPALERFIDWQPWNLPHKHDLHKQLLYPATPGSGADMAARRLHLVLLHVLQMMAIFDAAAMSTCLPMNGAASTEQVCSADLAFLGDASPLDLTALPALERFIDWQPWNLPHKDDLHKQLLYPATPGSGADMAARRLHLVLLQSYSCLPYGPRALHLAVTLCRIAYPAACALAMFVVLRRMPHLCAQTLLGTLGAAYITLTAATSPTPPLVDTDAGAFLVVLFWVATFLVLSYAKT